MVKGWAGWVLGERGEGKKWSVWGKEEGGERGGLYGRESRDLFLYMRWERGEVTFRSVSGGRTLYGMI